MEEVPMEESVDLAEQIEREKRNMEQITHINENDNKYAKSPRLNLLSKGAEKA